MPSDETPDYDARIPGGLAHEMREAYENVSAFIEHHTASVCPSCRSVCCIDRHGTHEPEDLALMDALQETPPPEPPLDDDTLPCRQLCATGCSLERWRRPYRCTWYFCAALLEAMPAENPRAYRQFVMRLRRLQDLRNQLWRIHHNNPF